MRRLLTHCLHLAAACLLAFIGASADSGDSSVTIRSQYGRPLVVIDNEPRAISAYSPVTHALAQTSTPRFFGHGLLAYFVNVPRAKNQGDWGTTPYWVGDRISSEPLAPFATPSMDEQAALILAGDPDARFIVRFGLHEPGQWREAYADQVVRNERGEDMATPSLASTQFHQDCARYVRAIAERCASRPWADRVIGFANFLRFEGSHDPLMKGWLFDHSPLMQQRWRAFLRERYSDDAALQAAWGDDTVTLSTATVPHDPFRRAATEVAESLFWQRAPATQAQRDYLALCRDCFHDFTRTLAAAQHAATEGRKFWLFDGYKQVMLGWHNHGFFEPGRSWPYAYHDMMAGAGHIGVAPLFDLSGFDGLITPHDYQARGLGGVFEPEGAADSMVLRGKIMLTEMDTRSYTGRDYIYPAQTDEEFAVITWRNIATALSRGFQLYWMDVHEDWFGSAGIHQIIRQQTQVINDSASWPHADVPGIAVILDDASVLETNGDGSFLNEAVMWELKTGVARCGVPHRTYLLDDLALANFPAHKVFYFPNLFRVDDERLALLKSRVFRPGNVVLWGPGSGISDGRTVAAEHASRLTGFAFDMIPVNYPRRVQVQDYDHPITAGLDEGLLLGSSLAYGPILAPRDGRRLGALWSKQGRLLGGLAVKEMPGGWHSVFSATMPIPPALWRGLARFSDTHIYSETNDIVLASRYVLGIHSIRSGAKHLRLPEPCRVVDVISGKTISERTVRAGVSVGRAQSSALTGVRPLRLARLRVAQ
jgi:hypothetical protein